MEIKENENVINLLNLKRNLYPFMTKEEFKEVNKWVNLLDKNWDEKVPYNNSKYLNKIYNLLILIMSQNNLIINK